MSERARIICWWIYAAIVVGVYIGMMQRPGRDAFVYAVGATLLTIVVLGVLLKALVRFFSRRGSGARREQTGKRPG